MEINGIPSLYLLMLFMLLCYATTTSKAVESDVSCLRSIKESLEDPFRSPLSTWEFDYMSEKVSCTFLGVECQPDTHMVTSLLLGGWRLRGPFPVGIIYCTSLQTLDLSENYLSGSIPFNIGYSLTHMEHFSLSNNSLSGPIPPSIVNWTYIKSIRLENNNLTGQIPPGLSALDSIFLFNVSNNRLSGPVPIFSTNFSAKSYANNTGLCGGPLKPCTDDEHDDVFHSGSAVGCTLFTFLSMVFLFFYFP